MAFRNWKQELTDQRPPRPSPWPLVLRLSGVMTVGGALTCLVLWVWPGLLLAKPWERPGPCPQEIVIYFSADAHGLLEPQAAPCDCDTPRWGGIARAAGLLAGKEAPADRLAFEVGDMAAGGARWQQLGLETYLSALGQMGYTAANVGVNEASIDAENLLRIARQSPVPMISANLLSADSREPILPPYHSFLFMNLRVCVLGVVELPKGAQPGRGLMVMPAGETLSRILPELRANADIVILLAACDASAIEQIARGHPEIDIILGGRVPQANQEILHMGGSWVAWHCNRGQVLGQVNVKIRPDGRCEKATSRMYELNNDVPEDPDMLTLIQQYNAELARLNRQGGLEAMGLTIRGAPAGGNSYAGTRTCASCHPSIYANWKKSKHAKAYNTLIGRQRENNPGCLKCHVVDLGVTDGFLGVAPSPQRLDVQCESCHGRAGKHVQARTAKADKSAGKLPRVTAARCAVCHDPVHSRDFTYPNYWKKMNHGKMPR